MNIVATHPDPHFIWPVQFDEHVKAWRWRRFMHTVYGAKL